jgi:hypothetical protein
MVARSEGAAIAAVKKKRRQQSRRGNTVCKKPVDFSKKKAALPDSVGLSGRITEDRIVRLLSIKFGCSLSVLQSHSRLPMAS